MSKPTTMAHSLKLGLVVIKTLVRSHSARENCA
jgi:hypothetical protein